MASGHSAVEAGTWSFGGRSAIQVRVRRLNFSFYLMETEMETTSCRTRVTEAKES
jgi:hypothetical protein